MAFLYPRRWGKRGPSPGWHAEELSCGAIVIAMTIRHSISRKYELT
jgi:hypothetical protein